jgi:uncharacterized protein YjbI with pentapeptide repeats
LSLLFAGFLFLFFGVREVYLHAGIVLLLVSALAMMVLRGWRPSPSPLKESAACLFAAVILSVAVYLSGGNEKLTRFILPGPLLLLPLAVLWQPRPRGSLALLLTLFIGPLLPLAFLVDGEGLEGLVRVQPLSAPGPSTALFAEKFLKDKRQLYLDKQVLLAKPPQPETLALIRSGQWQEGLKQVEPLNLKGRNLRHAQMAKVILIGADLREARLQDADLLEAQVQGAHLSEAQLQGAKLIEAQLQGAKLGSAKLQAADLREARLQGASLPLAQLQGAKLWKAQLQGADLRHAELQGANLGGAELQGANLGKAHLQGADLGGAYLQGAYLSEAQLKGANLSEAQLKGVNLRGAGLYSFGVPQNTELIDARGVIWAPLESKWLDAFINYVQTSIKDTDERKQVLDRLQRASLPGAPKLSLQSCLADSNTPLIFEKRYDPQKPQKLADFKKQLQDYLAQLACASPKIAHGVINQIPKEDNSDSSRKGLEVVLIERLADPKCAGLQGLSLEDKKRLQEIK